jgi:hypothetical protein
VPPIAAPVTVRSELLAAFAIAGRAVSAARLATIRSLRIVSSKVRLEGKRANTRKVHAVKKLFRLTSRNAQRSNCDFEDRFTFANKPNLYGVI